MSANTAKLEGLHHIAMRANDYDASFKFYTEGLGMKRAYGWGEGDNRACMLDLGDGNYLELFSGGKGVPGEDVPDGSFLHLALRTHDVDGMFARALAAGAVPTTEPKDVPIEGDKPLVFRIAFCKGLNGEILEFFYNDVL